jgi:taurine---2-oxoglutarate transaminase
MHILTEDPQQILQDNLDHTLFSWSKQTGLNPISN